jgi:hypothetical protein
MGNITHFSYPVKLGDYTDAMQHGAVLFLHYVLMQKDHFDPFTTINELNNNTNG